MNYSSLLLTIAEISGVLIGFANLASVIDKANENEMQQINKMRLLLITEGGIIIIIACLLPFLISSFNYGEVISFRIPSLIIAPVSLLYQVFNLRRGRRLTGIPLRVQMWGRTTDRKVGALVLPMILLSVGPPTLIATGYFDDGPIAGMYCLGVLVPFLIMFFFLIRFLRQIIL